MDREHDYPDSARGAEQHGNQAPLGTDDIIAEAMSQEIKKALEAEGEEDFPMLLFPVIPVGQVQSIRISAVRSQSYRTLTIISYDICVSLAHHGFKKLAFWYAMVGMRR